MPMPSYTLAARWSTCSRTPTSTSRMARMASGSPPSTTSCSPRLTKVSSSRSISGSSPSNPCLRAMVLHSTIFLMSCSACICGGLITQENRLMACLNTGNGVWMKIEAKVPTTTIMNAAADNNACRPAPLSTAPTMTATSASTKPTAESMSTRSAAAGHARDERVDVVLVAQGLAAGTRQRRSETAAQVARHLSRFQLQYRHAARVLAGGQFHQLREHGLELAHELDHAADDLAGKVLVALRQQHLRQRPAHALGVLHGALQAFVGALRPHRPDGDLA